MIHGQKREAVGIIGRRFVRTKIRRILMGSSGSYFTEQRSVSDAERAKPIRAGLPSGISRRSRAAEPALSLS